MGLLFSTTDHRLFSPNVHQPLSRLPSEGRRKRVIEGRTEEKEGQTAIATTKENQQKAKDEHESCCNKEGQRAAGSRRVTLLSCCVKKVCASFYLFVACNRNPPTIPTNHSSRLPVCQVGDIDEAETLTSVDLDGIKSRSTNRSLI